MQEFQYLIVGGGLTAASAVDGIRDVDPDGSIAILTDEGEPPYHRPPLSKEYLQTPDAPRELLHVKPAGWFDEQPGVTLLSETSAARIDAQALSVTIASGEEIRGKRILIATGGRPRTVSLPGADLPGVFTLRSVEDAEAIRDAAKRADRAVLIGSGFIGMELAASLRKFDVEPVVVELQDRVWPRMLPESLSGFMQGYFEDRGVVFRMGVTVDAIEGNDRVAAVILDGDVRIPCDVVVVGVGMSPNDGIAAKAGLGVQDGIVVDGFAETTAGHVYAAGDVARFPDPVFNDLTRLEHWDHAKAHGRLAGRNMAGEREAYDHVSYFFTNVFDLSINVFGRTEAADRAIVSGELGSGRSVVYCATDERLQGTILLNANDAMDECRELMRERPTTEDLLARLENPDAEIGELVG